MGCSDSAPLDVKNLKQQIKQNDKPALERYLCSLSMKCQKTLQSKEIEKGLFKLNVLSYSLIKGKDNAFKLFHSIGLSLAQMEENLRLNRLDPLRIICAKGYLEILKIYLPHYLRNSNNSIERNSSNFDDCELYIQTAVRFAQIKIMDHINNNVPTSIYPNFSISSAEGFNRENSILYACRFGHYFLLKHFYEKLNLRSEFYSKSIHGLGCIELCLVGNRALSQESFKSCLHYLIKTVRVSSNFTVPILRQLAQNDEIIEFLINAFESNGMTINPDNPSTLNSYRETFSYAYSNEMCSVLHIEDLNRSYLSSLRN